MTLKDIFKSITKKEWKQILWFTMAVILLTTAPIVYGYLNTPKGEIVSGIHALTSIDMNVYYSYLEQVRQGKIIFFDLFYSGPQTPLIFNIFWLGVGFMGKILKLNNIATFQLSRILLIPVFVVTIYIFISFFFTDKTKRQMALVFILFSSGLGAMLAPILEKLVYESYGYYHWPIDMWVAESITFLTLLHAPHFIASLILIILIFLFILLSWENNKLKYEIYAGLCGLILFQFHPFHLPTVFGVLGWYFLFLCFLNKKILFSKMRPLMILFLFTLPDLIYHVYILRDPMINQRAAQNICMSPSWWLTVIGFGFLVPLAIIGTYYIFTEEKKLDKTKDKFNKYHFLVCWLIIQTLLIYSPITFQRRMIEGLHIVLCLLTTITLFTLVKKSQKNPNPNKIKKMILHLYENKILLIIIFVTLFCFSNILNVARDIVFYKDKNILFYLPAAKKESFDWIKNNTENNSVFIGHITTSNFIAGNTGRFVYAGHTTETPFYETKEKQIKWLFANNNEDEKKASFLKSKNINFIYYSDWEKTYSNGNFDPSTKHYLKLVYKNDLVEIYKVISNS